MYMIIVSALPGDLINKFNAPNLFEFRFVASLFSNKLVLRQTVPDGQILYLGTRWLYFNKTLPM